MLFPTHATHNNHLLFEGLVPTAYPPLPPTTHPPHTPPHPPPAGFENLFIFGVDAKDVPRLRKERAAFTDYDPRWTAALAAVKDGLLGDKEYFADLVDSVNDMTKGAPAAGPGGPWGVGGHCVAAASRCCSGRAANATAMRCCSWMCFLGHALLCFGALGDPVSWPHPGPLAR